MAAEIAGRRICKVAGGCDAGQHSGFLCLGKDGIKVRTVGGDADVVVGGFPAGRKGCAARAGIGDKVAYAVGSRKPYHGEVVKVKLAFVEHPGATYLLQAHSVTYHEDDVAYLVVCRGRCDLYNVVLTGAGIVVELRFVLLLAGRCKRENGKSGKNGS